MSTARLAAGDPAPDFTLTDVMALASHIRDGVRAEFGITLVPECDLVGCSLT